MRSPFALVVAALLIGWSTAGPFARAQDASETQERTKRLHVVRHLRSHDTDCRAAAEKARATARLLRETAQRQPLDKDAVLRLRTSVEEQVAALAIEHKEFVGAMTAEQREQEGRELGYMDAVQARLQTRLGEIERAARAQKAAALVRHCRILERDLKDWSDQHAAISARLGLD